MNDKPKQEQFKFSLSKRDKHNREAKKVVEYFRGKGILSQAVRDGLRLINDLRKGNTRVLLELFPDIVDKICPPPSQKEDIDELKRMIEQLQQQQPKVVYVPSDGNIPEDAPVVGKSFGAPPTKPSLSAGQGSTLGAGVKLALPVFDDDDPDDGATLVLAARKDDMTTSNNLLASTFALFD